MEARRDEFRNYLETSGAITALTNVLIKLFELPEKPENSVKFICKHMAGGIDLEEENEELKRQLAEAHRRIDGLGGGRPSSAANKFRFTVSGSESDLEKLTRGHEMLQQNEECNSILKNFLTKEIIEQLADVKTETYNSTLLDCVEFGLREHCTPIGMLAADADCYNVFAIIFDPIIRHYHRIEDEAFQQPSVDWGDFNALIDPDPERVYISKCQINCYRSLKEFPFFLKMDENQYLEVMEAIRLYVQESGQDGTFHVLETIDEEALSAITASNTLGQEDFIFGNEHGDLESICYSAHWPKGRAIYVTSAHDLAIRVNHKTHVQFGCIQTDGNLITMYSRMSDYGKGFNEKVPCVQHEKYGWLTPFPQYLGAAVEISALVKLHQLPKDECKFVDYLDTVHLKLAKMVAEENYYYCDLRSVRCLGFTEFQIMERFCLGLANVFDAERELDQSNAE